ncbi:hypothetical protein QVD17_05565 [Tagetes erecta]|uniref:Uncharacterized protein n=1 Tax=Tagetes erecta TaxID=13708 RepID=A0AAD8LC78_TARER|nr:hypothetical protein QVD17_05565 [Tagetes erecta]
MASQVPANVNSKSKSESEMNPKQGSTSSSAGTTKDGTGLLRFIRTTGFSDVKHTATTTVPEDRPTVEEACMSKRHQIGSRKYISTSRFKVSEPTTKPVLIDIESTEVDDSVDGNKKKRTASPSKPPVASKSSGLPDQDPVQWLSQNGSLMNDPKACKDYLDQMTKPNYSADKKQSEGTTRKEMADRFYVSFAEQVRSQEEIQRQWLADINTIEKQKKLLEFFVDKQSRASAHSRELETKVASQKEKLVSYEKEQMELRKQADQLNEVLRKDQECISSLTVKLDVSSQELNQRAREVKDLNTIVDRMNNTLKAKDEELSTKQEAWASQKNYLMATIEWMKNKIQQLDAEKSSVANELMATVEPMKKQIQQLEVEKSSLANDRRWLITEGFKHVVKKLRTSEELLKPIGEVNTRAFQVGFQEGLKAGYHFSKTGVLMESTSWYDPSVKIKLMRATDDFAHVNFPYLEKLAACADAPLELLKSIEPSTSQASTSSVPVSK